MLISLLFLAALPQSAGPAPERLFPPAAMAAVATPEGRRNARAEFVMGLQQSEGAEVFASIRRSFPEDYEPLVDRLFAAALTHADDRNAAMDAAFALIADYIRTKSTDLVNAPTASLMEVNARTIALYRAAMTADVGFCAHIAMVGLDNPRLLPAVLRPQMQAISIATIDAAGAGHRSGAQVPGRGTLVPEHAAAWLQNLRSLDTDGTIVPLITDQAAAARATSQQQCRMGLLIFEAIGRSPPDTAASVLSYFLAQATQRARP